MLFTFELVSTFGTWVLTGLVFGDSALDIEIHDTYFVVAQFHLVMGVSAIFGMYSGIYHWFPKMYGKMMNKTLGYWHFWITIICAYGVFWPMHFIGLAGLPRRYDEPVFLTKFSIVAVNGAFKKLQARNTPNPKPGSSPRHSMFLAFADFQDTLVGFEDRTWRVFL